MNRRSLSFSSYEELSAEIERLRQSGYARLGHWSLGQVCGHLAYYFRGSLDGFAFKLPWIIRRLVGRRMLRRRLAGEPLPAGGRTIPASVPTSDISDEAGATEVLALLVRLRTARELHPSPLFDRLTLDQWRTLHLQHAAHHLSFLVPAER